MNRKTWWLLLGLPLDAAITNVQVSYTSTQAVIAYTAPTPAACSVEISESPSYTPVVHDVNPTKFPDSNADSRPGSVSEGTWRVFVAGKRSADVALDGKRYSRALQAATLHYYRINCGGQTVTGQFRTRTIPFGLSYNDPLPAAPGGEYAWPTVSWTDRSESIVDPLTGALLRRISLPRDRVEAISNNAVGTPSPASGWGNQGNVVADDSNAATYSGTTSTALFVPAEISIYQGG